MIYTFLQDPDEQLRGEVHVYIGGKYNYFHELGLCLFLICSFFEIPVIGYTILMYPFECAKKDLLTARTEK